MEGFAFMISLADCLHDSVVLSVHHTQRNLGSMVLASFIDFACPSAKIRFSVKVEW